MKPGRDQGCKVSPKIRTIFINIKLYDYPAYF